MPLEAGRRVGAYEILAPLGAGGMGEVYRARDIRLGRLVAIKFVSADYASDPHAADRLAREAQLTSSLNHPNIVTVHDVGESDGRPFIVMELIAGKSLHQTIEDGRLKPSAVLKIGCQIADGLAAAHEAGVVHRDLKPRNIMIGDDGRTKIVDFGLGKSPLPVATSDEETVRAPSLTAAHVVLGTVGYLSPEQVSGRPVTFQSDQFALGAILYEMITGRRAFARETPVQTMAAVLEAEPEPIAQSNPDTPGDLVTVVAHCLAKHPHDRYASTKDLAKAMHDAQQSLTAPRPLIAAVRPPVRPWKRWLGAAAVLAGVLFTWYWFATRHPELTEARALLNRYDKPDNVDRALALLEPIAARGANDARVFTMLAEGYWYKYEFTRDNAFIDKAAEAASTSVKLNEQSADVHVVLAMINLGQGRADGGLGEAKRALELDPGHARAWRELGRANLRLNKTDLASEALTKAVSLGPDDWTTRNNLGAFHFQRGKFDEAEREFLEVLKLAPDNTKAYNNLGSTYLQAERYDKAAQMLERSASLDRRNPLAFSNLGLAYYRQGLYVDACRWFENAASVPNAQSTIWRNLGAACYWAPGKRDRAKAAMEQALAAGMTARDRDPKDAKVVAELADSHAVLSLFPGDAVAAHRTSARTLIAELESRQPLEADVMFMLASTHEQLGDRATAIEWLARAVNMKKELLKDVERSPWLKQLRQDPRYAQQVRQP